MPIKIDGDKRWVEMDFLVPGAAEEVWRAIATGPGIGAWFTETKVDEFVGGTVRFDFGEGASSTGVVTVFDAPHRFEFEEHHWSGEAPPVSSEFRILPRQDGACVVHLRHLLVSPRDTWDAELESFERGWPECFEVLRIYMSHFRGEAASAFRVSGPIHGSALEGWTKALSTLGLAGSNVGEHRKNPGAEPVVGGVVETTQQNAKGRELLLRLSQPGPGVLTLSTYTWGNALRVSASVFFYGESAEDRVGRHRPSWEHWIEKHFPPEKG